MLHKILKQLIFLPLLLCSVMVGSAQVPQTSFELTSDPGDNKHYIARDYIKLLPGFQYAAKAATSEYNPTFVAHMDLLYSGYLKNIGTGTANNVLSTEVLNYITWKYPIDAIPFTDYVSKSSSYDPSIPVNVDIPPTTFRASIDEFMTFPAVYDQAQLPFSTSNEVGSLPGSAGVSPTGAATYTIPISLPPGTAGMVPNLSIAYSSQSPGGMMGTGWSVGGFSAITRVPTNLHDDGEIDGVNFNASDKFALDGNRLVVTNALAYGANGAEYHTQMETFSQIYSYGLAGTGPEKFIVETKDGKKLEYGYTADSRFIADGRSDVTMWLLNKITDKLGNYYTITYHMESKEYYPKEIRYTGNANANLFPYNVVKFHFDDKSDPSIGFVASSEMNSSVILREIVIECEGSQVNKYEFKYTEGFTSKLNEIVYYAGSTLLNSTKFDWGIKTADFDLKTTNIAGSVDYCPGDYNGDGKTDMAILFKKKDINGYLVFDQYGYPVYSQFEIYYSNGNGNTFTIGTATNLNKHVRFLPGDFNGDGKTDILSLYGVDNSSYYGKGIYFSTGEAFTYKGLLITGTGFDSRYSSYNVGDFNGDGRTDWLKFDKNADNYCEKLAADTYFGTIDIGFALKLFVHIPTANSVKKYEVADFNGNGKSDIMMISDTYDNNSCQIFEYINGSTELNMFHSSGFPSYVHRLFPGDFNGDGKTDLLSWVDGQSGWEIHYYGEDDFIWTKFPETPNLLDIDPEASVENNNFVISDFNGDGKADILEQYSYSTNTFNIYYSKGSSFKKVSTSISNIVRPLQFQYYVSNDFNGDGKNDCFLASGYYADYRNVLLFNPFGQENLMTLVTNGLNTKTKFEYLPYTDSRVYTSGTGSNNTNKVAEIRPAIPVVYRLYQQNGIGSNFNFKKFWYKGLKFFTEGKRLIGFEGVFNYDNYDVRTDTEYEYDPLSYNNLLKRSGTHYVGKGNFTSYEYETVSSYSGKVFLSNLKTKTESNTLDYITVTTTYGFDSFGNNTLQAINHDLEGTTDVTNEYIDANTWCPSAIKKSTVTKTRTGKTPYSRVTDFYYYPNGTLEKQVNDPLKDKELTTTYITNTIGLAEKISISAPGEETRHSSIVYDSKWRFPIKETNTLGFVTEKTHDPKNGNVLTETDILGHIARHSYDIFGNLQQTTLPDGNKITVTKGWSNNSPVNSVYFVEKTADGSAPVKVYYNLFGKELLSETNGFNGTKIYVKTNYDAKGQVFKKYEPSFSSTGGSITTYNYDLYGRIDDIISPTGTTDYLYATKSSTIIDPSGKSSSKTINAYGDVTLAHDNGGDISYQYNSAGLPETITAPGGAVVSLTYDLHGNKDSITDPDAGTINYTYDAFGNLKSQKDAKSNSYTMDYDVLGRITTKTGPEGTTTYAYDVAPNGKGQIASVTGFNGITQNFEYDVYGRLLKSTELVDSKPFVYSYTYDQFGRESQMTYPSGFATKSVYNTNGYLSEVQKSDGTLIWKGETVNALGQMEQAQLGSLKRIYKAYDPYHRLSSITYDGYATLGYVFDMSTGNLDSRTYFNPASGVDLSESFTYDLLNRLDIAQVGTNPPYLDMAYDAGGNITFKDDAGNFAYNHPTKLHAVTDITGNTGTIPSADQNITYNGFNKVSLIKHNDPTSGSLISSMSFVYGPDKYRRKTVLSDNSGILMTKYFAGAYEEEITTSETRKIHYIAGGDGLAAVFIIDNANPAGKLYYTFTDHLGSIVAITNDAGTVLEEQSFDPWGRRVCCE